MSAEDVGADQPNPKTPETPVKKRLTEAKNAAEQWIEKAVSKVPQAKFLYVLIACVAASSIALGLAAGRVSYALVGGMVMLVFLVTAVLVFTLRESSKAAP